MPGSFLVTDIKLLKLNRTQAPYGGGFAGRQEFSGSFGAGRLDFAPRYLTQVLQNTHPELGGAGNRAVCDGLFAFFGFHCDYPCSKAF